MFGRLFGKKPLSIEERLEALRPFGIALNPGRTVAEMLESWTREQHAEDPALLFVSLGSEVEVGPNAGEYFCNSLWHFDTECIEDHGAYVRIAERFRILAGGQLPLTDITDYVDIEADEARLEFCLDGKPFRWDAEVDNDWVDPTVMSRFAKLLEDRRSTHRYTYLDFGGQDCLIGCLRPEVLRGLSKVTGLDWKLLS